MLDPVDAAALKFADNALERCATPMLQRKFVALGGVDMILNFLSVSVNDEVVSKAAQVLQSIAGSSNQACLRIVKLGGVPMLLRQLRQTRNREVLLSVTWALRSVLELYSQVRNDEGWADVEMFTEQWLEDAPEVMVELLVKSAGEQMTREASALIYYACTCRPVMMAPVGRAGGVHELLKVCSDAVSRQRSSHEAIGFDWVTAEWAVNALCVLLMTDANHDTFAAGSGPATLVALLKMSCKTEILEQGARALSNFMCTHKSQQQVTSVGGAEVLVSHIQMYVGQKPPKQGMDEDALSGGVMEQMCAAICNLTFENDSTRVRVGDAGGCQSLVLLIKSEMENQEEAVVRQACAAIGNICKKNRTNRSLVGSWGGCEALLDVIRCGAPTEQTRMQAVRAIGNVAMRMPDNQLKFTAADGPRLLLALVETLSLRLAPVGAAAALEAEKSSVSLSSQHGRMTPRSPGNRQSPGASNRTSAASTPRGGAERGQEHEESFLMLTLAALLALSSHQVCVAQLAADEGALGLLERIGQTAAYPQTQDNARRLLANVRTTPEYDQQQQQQQGEEDQSAAVHLQGPDGPADKGAAGLPVPDPKEQSEGQGFGAVQAAAGPAAEGVDGQMGQGVPVVVQGLQIMGTQDSIVDESVGSEIGSPEGGGVGVDASTSEIGEIDSPEGGIGGVGTGEAGSPTGLNALKEHSEWQSDCEEEGAADHHSDACSVASFYSSNGKSQGKSLGSRRSSRCSRMSGVGVGGDGYLSERDSLHSTSQNADEEGRFPRSSSGDFGGIFSDGSDGELDLEGGEPGDIRELKVAKNVEGLRGETTSAMARQSPVELLVETHKLTLLTEKSNEGEMEEEDPPPQDAKPRPEAAAAVGCIDVSKEDSTSSGDAAEGAGRVAVASPKFVVPPSPLSGDGSFTLPEEIVAEMAKRKSQHVAQRRLGQRVFDLWLTEAEKQQRISEGMRDMRRRRGTQTKLAVTRAWAVRALGEDYFDACAEYEEEARYRFGPGPWPPQMGGGMHGVGWSAGGRGYRAGPISPYSPQGGGGGMWGGAQSVQSEESAATVRTMRSVCSEESISTDARTVPSFSHGTGSGLGGHHAAVGGGGDMTVASESSTRTLGSELSQGDWAFQGVGEGVSHAGGGGMAREAEEEALEVSKRALQTLLIDGRGGAWVGNAAAGAEGPSWGRGAGDREEIRRNSSEEDGGDNTSNEGCSVGGSVEL